MRSQIGLFITTNGQYNPILSGARRTAVCVYAYSAYYALTARLPL